MVEGTRGDNRPQAGSVDPGSWGARASASGLSNLAIPATVLRFPHAQRPHLPAAGWRTCSPEGQARRSPARPGSPAGLAPVLLGARLGGQGDRACLPGDGGGCRSPTVALVAGWLPPGRGALEAPLPATSYEARAPGSVCVGVGVCMLGRRCTRARAPVQMCMVCARACWGADVCARVQMCVWLCARACAHRDQEPADPEEDRRRGYVDYG